MFKNIINSKYEKLNIIDSDITSRHNRRLNLEIRNTAIFVCWTKEWYDRQNFY